MRAIRRVASAAAGLLLAATAAPAAAQRAAPIEVLDARVAEYDATSRTWLLQGGPVRVRRGDLEVAASRILYRERERVAVAEGAVRARQRGQTATADRAYADMERQTIALTGNVVLEYETPDLPGGQTGGPAVLRAPAVDADLRAKHAVARGGVHATWGRVELKSEGATADLAARVVVAEGGPVATVDGVRVEAERMRADLASSVLHANGRVRVADSRVVAAARGLEVRWAERVAMLLGEVVARRGSDVMRADAVRYELASGRLIATGRPRVVVHP